jgi:glutamyl-tRNA synthetase
VRFEGSRREWIRSVLDLLKPRARKLGDLVPQLRPFLTDGVERDPAAVEKHLSSPEVIALVPVWRDRLRTVEPFDAPTLEAALRGLADERGVKAGALIHATRVAVTGQAVSPGLFDVLALMGRDRVVARLSEIQSRG